MKKVFVSIFLLLFTCSTIMAHPISDREQAITDAKVDVELVTVDNLLIGVGTGLGLSMFSFGILLYEYHYSTSSCQWPPLTTGSSLVGSALGTLYLMRIQVPAAKLLGKSPEYVYAYTKTYQDKLRIIRAGSTALGCLTGCVVGIITLNLIIPESYDHHD